MGAAGRRSGEPRPQQMPSELAAQAHELYNSGDYDATLRLLSELAARHEPSDEEEEDLTLTHNTAICEYAKTGFAETQQFGAALRDVRSKLRARASMGSSDGTRATGAGDGGEDASGGAASLSTAYRQGIPFTESAASAAEGLADLDTDASVVLYNMAALHFQQMQYGAARAILEHLFLHIEPVDEPLAIHICFLLLDALCHSARGALHSDAERKRFAQQTSVVLAFLERPHALNASAAAAPPDSSAGGKDGGADNSNSKAGSGGGGGAGEDGAAAASLAPDQTEFQFRLHLYKAKVLLLLQDHKPCKKEVKSALEIFQRELRKDGAAAAAPPATSHSPSSGGEAGAQGAFHPVPPPGVQNLTALYLKANLEYLRDNYKKALKLLASCHGFQGSEEYAGPGEPAGPHYHNNMGCLHHKLGKHHAALHYFNKALAAVADGMRAGATGALACGAERDGRVAGGIACEILYNAGLQLLLTAQPAPALRCLERAALLFYNRPRLWLRMAEAALVRASVGAAAHRRLLLPLNHPRKPSRAAAAAAVAAAAAARAKQQGGGGGGADGGGVVPLLHASDGGGAAAAALAAGGTAATLENASRCLKNVLYLGLAAARAERATAEGSAREPGASMLGVSMRITAKNLEAKERGGGAAGADGGGGGSAVSDAGSSGSGAQHGGSGGSASTAAAAWDREPVCQAALLCLAYVHLGLDDPVQALAYAQRLLGGADSGGGGRGAGGGGGLAATHAVLARMYSAEALMLLDRPNAALEQLQPAEEQLSTAAAANAKAPDAAAAAAAAAGDSASDTSPAALRVALHVNLATAHVLRGDGAAAERCLWSALRLAPQAPAALRLLAYVLLRKGLQAEALAVLKEGRLGAGGTAAAAAAAGGAVGR
ncbi:hypothetical protein JKP88DRAFT_346820 [Tribonema minus]|uniref:CCR4-NOT transcription complex subunit 10 n=1 Tax=Tribonema minus TaxID=303371 RepID=A0A836CBQ7_9STRA|nr:hypothetical protein JKP88DRAFT_346820 [Tribonema minus]